MFGGSFICIVVKFLVEIEFIFDEFWVWKRFFLIFFFYSFFVLLGENGSFVDDLRDGFGGVCILWIVDDFVIIMRLMFFIGLMLLMVILGCGEILVLEDDR